LIDFRMWSLWIVDRLFIEYFQFCLFFLLNFELLIRLWDFKEMSFWNMLSAFGLRCGMSLFDTISSGILNRLSSLVPDCDLYEWKNSLFEWFSEWFCFSEPFSGLLVSKLQWLLMMILPPPKWEGYWAG
jgi:hypothetical protein